MTTILFVKDIPVAYQVYKTLKCYFFKPVTNPDRKIIAPILFAFKINDTWRIVGADDESLREQVVEKIHELQCSKLPVINLTAAV